MQPTRVTGHLLGARGGALGVAERGVSVLLGHWGFSEIDQSRTPKVKNSFDLSMTVEYPAHLALLDVEAGTQRPSLHYTFNRCDRTRTPFSSGSTFSLA